MLTKLVDFLIQFIDAFRFLTVVREWETAVVLRLGRYHRTLPPGLHFLLPLHVEHVCTEWQVPYPRQLAPQSLTTADGVAVVVSAVVTTRCVNARRLVCESGGHETAVLDSAAGTIATCVSRAQWTDLVTPEFQQEMTACVDVAAHAWGLVVDRVQFADVARCRTVRLVGTPKSADLS